MNKSMKNSAIISLFIFLFKKIFEIYNGSFLEKIIKSVCDFFVKRSKNSFFCSLFKGNFIDASFFKNSILFKILSFPLQVVYRISNKVSDTLSTAKKSSELLNIFNNLIYIPIRQYGYIAFSFTLGIALSLVYNGAMTKNSIILMTIVAFISLVMMLLPVSICSLSSSSIALKPFKNLFNRYSVTNDYDKSEIRVFNIKAIGMYALIFFAIGIGAGFSSPTIAILSILFAIAIAIILHHSLAGVFMLVFFAPIMPTMVCVGLFALNMLSFAKDFVCDKNKRYIMTPIDFLVASFMLLEVFSAFTSFNIPSSFLTLAINIAFTMVYFIIVNSVKTKNQWYNLVLTFVFAGVIVGMYGIIQNFLVGTTDTSWIDEDMFEGIGTRVYSTFDNPNVLGQYLVMVIPVAFALMCNSKKASDKFIMFLSVAIMTLCIVFTWSRAAWVGVILAIGFFMLMKDRRWSAFCVLALIILPFVLPESIISRITSIGDLNDSSTAYRVSVWIASLRMGLDYLFTGIGLGTGAFERVYQNYALNGAGFALHSHNFYIQLVVEMGIFALILFLLIMFSAYKGIISIQSKKSANKDVALAIGGALIGYMFQGMAENLWYNYRMVLIFWIYLALLQTGINVTRSDLTTVDSIKE